MKGVARLTGVSPGELVVIYGKGSDLGVAWWVGITEKFGVIKYVDLRHHTRLETCSSNGLHIQFVLGFSERVASVNSVTTTKSYLTSSPREY